MSKCSMILTVLFVSLAASPVFAESQTTHRSVLKKNRVSEAPAASNENTLGFQLGLSVGSGSWNTDSGNQPNLDTRTRPTFGFYYEREILTYLSARPELNYVQRGFSSSEGGRTTETAANYLEFPILAKAQYPVGSFTPYFLTGPFLGLAMGSGVSTDGGGAASPNSIKVNTFNFGWDFGLGSTYALTKQFKLEASLRYSLGLTNTYSDAPSGQSVDLSAFQFLTGISMPI